MFVIFRAAGRSLRHNCESSPLFPRSSRYDVAFSRAVRWASGAAAARTLDDSSSTSSSKQGSSVRKKAEMLSGDLGKKPKIQLIKKKLSPSRASTTSSLQEHPLEEETEDDEEQRSLPSDEHSRAAIYDSEDLQRLSRLDLPEAVISAEALFLARSIDLKALALDHPSLGTVLPCRNHVVIKLDHAAGVAVAREDYVPMHGCLSTDKVAVVFQYGAVVLFNFHDLSPDSNPVLQAVRRHSREFLREPRRDNYRVVVIPGLGRWSQGGSDKIMVKKLDMDGVRIISLVLGQSIALDHYTRSIDAMLTTFGDLNQFMEQTGTFRMQRQALFRLVAAANAALADAILRLGLLERFDAAWQSARYDRMWEHMRDEFELEDRFESLEFKIGIIQHNVKFFLDILQNRRSDTLEWIIIGLISMEIFLSLY